MGGADDLAFVVLAAGRGTRLPSRLPKALQPVCGRPILAWQLRLARELGARATVVVIGEADEAVRELLAEAGAEVVQQAEPRGTAHAALQAQAALERHEGAVLITYGDHALYRPETFAALLERYREEKADLALLTAEFPGPSGFGRIVRGPDGGIERIVEERDATPEIRALREVNPGVYVGARERLFEVIARVGSDNAQGEYYLTDVVELYLNDGARVTTLCVRDWEEALGINDRSDLARAEQVMRRRIAERWLAEGVGLVDPEHTYIDADVAIGPDSVIGPGCSLRGTTRIGAGARLEPGVVIDSSRIGDECWIKPHSWIEESSLGARCVVGPSAHVRPGCELADEVRIGNFVEVKNSSIGPGTKADHLSYVGDADVGSGVTIGCGAITVNYDGERKSRTVIGDGAFVGCNANLIAPVTVEPQGYVAAGSTITQDVPEGALGVARARQRNVEGWRRRRFGDGES